MPYWRIRMDMRDLETDVRAWLADTTPGRFGHDECALRFGYRLVVIHPFPNGNGRCSRLASDALIVSLGGRRFTWGGASLTETSELRRRYIGALQAADVEQDFGPLIAFGRSQNQLGRQRPATDRHPIPGAWSASYTSVGPSPGEAAADATRKWCHSVPCPRKIPTDSPQPVQYGSGQFATLPTTTLPKVGGR